jgi:hypothetical protein
MILLICPIWVYAGGPQLERRHAELGPSITGTGSIVFERNRLSRMVRYNMQDAYLGCTPDS